MHIDTEDQLTGLVGQTLKQLRIDSELTQDEVADLAGLKQSHIARVEQKGVKTVATMVRLATAMGYRVIIDFQKREETKVPPEASLPAIPKVKLYHNPKVE